jgi:ubiquinone/menaquinone biosynthesis C-methylase UbiE
MISKYVHPLSKIPLVRNDKGHLCELNKSSVVFYCVDGTTYDFVSSGMSRDEREFFDETYKKGPANPISIKICEKLWFREPGFRELLESMGDVSGKKILLLGNGVSLKEFYFLKLGAKCVYTDLSIQAIRHIKKKFTQSEFHQVGLKDIEFHAVDACHMPFASKTFDIVYGCSFVHHIDDIEGLFNEVDRCLKPGGICRFHDHAYSPMWQFAKKTFLRPLQRYTHRKCGISPADVIATEKGGFTKSEIEQIKVKLNFKEMMFLKVGFIEQLLQRGTCKLGCRSLRMLKLFSGRWIGSSTRPQDSCRSTELF